MHVSILKLFLIFITGVCLFFCFFFAVKIQLWYVGSTHHAVLVSVPSLAVIEGMTCNLKHILDANLIVVIVIIITYPPPYKWYLFSWPAFPYRSWTHWVQYRACPALETVAQ